MPLNKSTTSVIIPAFNAEKTLQKTLASVHAQSCKVDEIIIGDDGSTDRTVEVGRANGAIVVELPKGNGSIARNRAFEKSTGEFILLLDADDTWLPNKVEIHLETWSKHPEAGFLIDPSQRIRANGERRGVNGAGPAGKLSAADMVRNKNWSCGSAISVRRNVWEEIGGFNENLPGLQDIDFMVRAASNSGYGWRISQVLTEYFLYDFSVSKSVTWDDKFVAKVKKSMSCLTDEEFFELVKVIKLRNGANLGFPAGLPELLSSKVMPWDVRFGKAIYFGILKSFELRKLKNG